MYFFDWLTTITIRDYYDGKLCFFQSEGRSSNQIFKGISTTIHEGLIITNIAMITWLISLLIDKNNNCIEAHPCRDRCECYANARNGPYSYIIASVSSKQTFKWSHIWIWLKHLHLIMQMLCKYSKQYSNHLMCLTSFAWLHFVNTEMNKDCSLLLQI